MCSVANDPTQEVLFTLSAPEAHGVALVGDFNNWDPTACRLQQTERGYWRARVKLPPGTREYRYIVDGTWVNDPYAEDVVRNPFGTENCVVHVGPRQRTCPSAPSAAGAPEPESRFSRMAAWIIERSLAGPDAAPFKSLWPRTSRRRAAPRSRHRFSLHPFRHY